MKKTGKVYLVGAGPGDPGLITKRGLDLIRLADVIVVDALVNPVLLQASQAKIVFAGKRGSDAPSNRTAQEKINRWLISYAQSGLRVVRLKGGDPIVFGRGSEEMEALHKARVPYDVVPGVTSAIAVPAYAGIPITARRWSSQVTFLAGQSGQSEEASTHQVDWGNLSQKQTLVILMGVITWPLIQKKLLASGWPQKKPVAAIEWGTTSHQRVVLTDLQESVRTFKTKKLSAPSIIIVGDVARLSQRLSWLKKEKPLVGRRVVVTRAAEQAQNFISMLEEKGAEVISAPAINLVPIKNDPFLNAFYAAGSASLEPFDWAIFLSANAVAYFADGLTKKILPQKMKICAVGPLTRIAIEKQGWRVQAQAKEFSARGVLPILGSVKDKRILLPRVKDGPRDFVDELRKRGARVKELVCYRNEPAPAPSKQIKNLILAGVDAITFTSPSTVRNFCQFFREAEIKKIFKRAQAVSIGTSTTLALRDLGIRNILTSASSTTDQLISVLQRFFNTK